MAFASTLRGLATAGALALAVSAALAYPGGPGRGAGRGPCGGGYGFGPNEGAACSLLTHEEWTEHRARMHSFQSYDECKSYMSEFSKQLQQRAKEKGTTAHGPNEFMCDRMRERGFLK